jgi:inner membrane protein
MDPIAHAFTGAALAAAGLRRATPLATAALLIGANVPDVDGLSYFAGSFEAVAFRRGLTHGVLALALWPFVLAGLLLLWDRWIRRRRHPTATPARAGPLLALSALAVITHPTLDWVNNYGLRWLMPFDGRWFYGDALFVIDPWVWLGLGGVLFLAHSKSARSLSAWIAFWLAASLAVVGNAALVPLPARLVWVGGLAALAALRWAGFAAPARGAALERAARVALGVFAIYVGAAIAASAAARAQVRAALEAEGIAGVETVMVAPAAANPFGGDVVVATADDYYIGRWRWLGRPRLRLDERALDRPRGAIYEAAARAADARKFLVWARFPFIETEPGADGALLVRFSDVRYRAAGRLTGPTVRLERAEVPAR